MRPAMESALDVEESDLMQILSHVVEEVRDSVGQDINGVELLYELLNAPWLQSLLKVYECLQQYLKSSTVPHLSYASGLSLEILSDLRALPYPSHEARELYTLLAEPHLQALLSAHDVVGLKDYEPILPPLPEDLPEDEEAMRIVCLVKNNQPLNLRSHVGRAIRNHWDTLRQRFSPANKVQSGGLCTKKHDDVPQKLRNNPAEVPSSCKPVLLKTQSCSRYAGSCKLCQNSVFANQSLSCSAPCVCSSIDDIIDSMDVEDDPDMKKPILPLHPHYTLSPWMCISHPYLNPCCCHSLISPPLPPRLACYTRTAPPSPMHGHRLVENMGMQLAKQESLGELRSMVQQAVSCMQCGSQDIKLLGQRMADATEHMSESTQENAQALALLAEVVEKLQGLVALSGAASAPLTAAAHGEEASKESTDAYPDSRPRIVVALANEASEDCGTKLQGPVTDINATSAAVKFKEMSEEPIDGMLCNTETSCFGNGKPFANANASPSVQPSRVISTSPDHFTHRHFRCPSCSSSTSSSSSSISNTLEQPVASQGRLCQKVLPQIMVKMPASPRSRFNGHCSMPNGLGVSSSSQTLRNSSSGIGCLSDLKKKRKKMKKGSHY